MLWIVENIVKNSLDWNQYIQAQLSSLFISFIAIFLSTELYIFCLGFGMLTHIERKHKLNYPADVFAMKYPVERETFLQP